uniref:Ig-like domain-containing protein n=1 Tax=Pygocentrus nattereri TaxID=42514 RepID=A0A3B4CPA8_PYGNA
MELEFFPLFPFIILGHFFWSIHHKMNTQCKGQDYLKKKLKNGKNGDTRGESVLLPCPSPFEYGDTVSVKWEKDGESGVCMYRMSENKTSGHVCSPRFKVNADPIGLIITDVTGSDAGNYNCSMIRMIPPPAVDDFSILILQVNGDYTLLYCMHIKRLSPFIFSVF